MDVFADLWLGFATALSPTNLVYLLIGTIIGRDHPGFWPLGWHRDPFAYHLRHGSH